MKLLLVEDEAPKRAHVTRFIEECALNCSVECCRSVTSALDSLENAPPDLMILDMSLPTFDIDENEDGGRPQGFGGLEVLRYMTMAEITCPVVVLTGYDAFKRHDGTIDLSKIRSELHAEFPSFLLAVLHFNSSFDEWRPQLAELLRKFRK